MTSPATPHKRKLRKNPEQPARRPALLAAAAAEFNARGISGARLTAIARRLGITHAALYYYFENREDLAFACYQHSCEVLAEDLAQARRLPGNALAQLAGFIRTHLDPGRAPFAALTEIAHLQGERRAQIESLHAANARALRALIDQGIEQGSIRPCDSEVITHTLIGILSWLPLAADWSGEVGAQAQSHAAAALSDMVTHGVFRDPDARFVCPVPISRFDPPAGNAFDRQAQQTRKVELLIRTASTLFNRQGIDGTSLDDITGALGATKGAFYHYFRNKNELIVLCFRRAFDLYEAFLETAQREGRNGLERSFIGLHLNVQAQASSLQPMSPLSPIGALPARQRRQLQERALRTETLFAQLSAQAISEGGFRAFDVTTIAIAGAGAFGWLPKWRSPQDPRSPRFLADEICSLFGQGLEQRANGGDSTD